MIYFNLLIVFVTIVSAENIIPITEVNSAYLSHLKFKLRHLSDPVLQCVKYLEGIKYKKQGLELVDDNFQSTNVNIDILIEMIKILKNREKHYSTNALIEYTDRCIKILSDYKGTDYIIKNDPIDDSTTNNQSEETDQLTELKNKNEKLNENIQTLINESTKKDIYVEELENKILIHEKANFEKNNLKNEMEQLRKDIEELKNEKRVLIRELDANNVTYQQMNTVERSNAKLKSEIINYEAKLNEQQVNLNQCLAENSNEMRNINKDVINELENNLKACKESEKKSTTKGDNKEELEKCRKQLKTNQAMDTFQQQIKLECQKNLNQSIEKLNKCNLERRRLESDRDKCYKEAGLSMVSQDMIEKYKKVTKEVAKFLNNDNFEVECAKWNVGLKVT